VKSALALFVAFIASSLSLSQDVQVREQATRLLEKANAVSTAPNLPNLERTDTFQVFGPDSGVREGTFSRVVIQGVGRREETAFDDYHVVNVWTKEGLTTERANVLAPPEVKTLMRLTPVYRVRFDHEDVIHRIVDREVNGRAARCIEFDTIAGQKTDSNELCVDFATGVLLLGRLGHELIENRDFFPFAGALLPAKISYSFAGVQKMEITQSMAELSSDTANVLAAPPTATLHRFCTTYRRPFGQSMPQPKSGNGGTNTDVVVRGFIAEDGRIHDAVIQSSDRLDLNSEALALVRQWTFTPGLCNGKPTRTEASFTLYFQGR
jgi:TonB family protein